MRISILIPTCARPEQLREALASIAIQDLSLVGEILISDDSPPEHVEANRATVTASGLGSLIRYWVNSPALGTYPNHWFLASEAREAHMLFLHDDDAMCPGGLAALADACNAETDARVKLWFGTQFIVDEAGVIDPVRSEQNDRAYGRTAGEAAHPVWEWCLKHSIPPDGYLVETATYRLHMRGERDGNVGDWAFVVRLANQGVWARYIGETVSHYRVQLASNTSSGRGTDVHLLFEHACKLKVPPEHEAEKRERFYGSMLVVAVRYLRDGERGNAWRAWGSSHLPWRQRFSLRAAAVLAMLLTPRPVWFWALRYKDKR